MLWERTCRDPLPGLYTGTYSVTSIGGVASTFLLEWFRQLEQAHRQTIECKSGLPAEKTVFKDACNCPVLAGGHLPLHLVSCHIDDDGVFKHLADPSALTRFPNHRAVYIVGSPIDAIASVFRRRFQCWHLYRLNNCWFTRAQREGLIPCQQPGIRAFRSRFGTNSSVCRVPDVGPLSSLAAYTAQGEDLFGINAQFRSWLSCRRPQCNFDILVIRYETLNESLTALFDFLEVPAVARRSFPAIRESRTIEADAEERRHHRLERVYGRLEEAINQIPPAGLLLRNR